MSEGPDVANGPEDFAAWRAAARELLARGVPPAEADWGTDGPSLFGRAAGGAAGAVGGGDAAVPAPTVSVSFLEAARAVAAHRDPKKWDLLYRLLWRIAHGEKRLLEAETDPDVRALRVMEKAVERDVHKTHAFVRFRKLGDEERYVAFHKPDHLTLRLAAPFFARRFARMHWVIVTPDATAAWDTETLAYGAGSPGDSFSGTDDLERLWTDYYASVFNPARVKVKAMKAEMPVRHWATLPEAGLIPGLLKEAGKRVERMTGHAEAQRALFVTPDVNSVKDDRSYEQMRAAALCCTSCPLHENATQTVFGEGPTDAKVVFVGEQPGDEEDLQGRPFVGPAGRLFADALAAAGIDRERVYVTNAVKHFKWIPRGKRRIHQKPNGAEVNACRQWLDAELAVVKPDLVVCLGATAARSVLGREVAVLKERGTYVERPGGGKAFLTVHPSSVLRVPEEGAKREAYEKLVADLRTVGPAA